MRTARTPLSTPGGVLGSTGDVNQRVQAEDPWPRQKTGTFICQRADGSRCLNSSDGRPDPACGGRMRASDKRRLVQSPRSWAEDEIQSSWRVADPAGRSGGARDLNGRTRL